MPKVAVKVLSGRNTLHEIVVNQSVRPIQVSEWKKQLLKGASELPAGDAQAIKETVKRPRGDRHRWLTTEDGSAPFLGLQSAPPSAPTTPST